MATLSFSKRCFKEIIRDPISIIFAIILPLFLLFIFTQINIPSPNYQINNLTPGIIIFSYSFITMFTATLVAKDRSTLLLIRLGISPMKTISYILGYVLAIMPIVIIQNLSIYLLGLILNLNFSVRIIYAILLSLPISFLFIGLGIIIGSLVSDKAAAGVSSIVVQVVSFTSEMYFDASMLSKGFSKFCDVLPFASCVDILKALISNTYDNFVLDIIKVFCYTIIVLTIACIIFKRKLTK